MTCETIYRHTCDRCAHICEADSQQLPGGWSTVPTPAISPTLTGWLDVCDTCTKGLRKFWSRLA